MEFIRISISIIISEDLANNMFFEVIKQDKNNKTITGLTTGFNETNGGQWCSDAQEPGMVLEHK
jgi:hypothetical protein